MQILTKGDGSRDFDLLDENDWYGVTCSGAETEDEPGAIREDHRIWLLAEAKHAGIHTWVSFEPVINDARVLAKIMTYKPYIDKVKVGKLNYYPSDTCLISAFSAARSMPTEPRISPYI